MTMEEERRDYKDFSLNDEQLSLKGGCFQSMKPSICLKVCLVGGVEKWVDRNQWKDGKVRVQKIFSFLMCLFGWKGGKVGR